MLESDHMSGMTGNFSRRAFVQHLVEMLLAMVVGMVVLDEVAQVTLSSLLSIDLFANPGLFAPVMTLDMTIGMTLWMFYRRHTLVSVGEMSGAMVLPLCLLIGPHWAGIISGSVLLAGNMALSLPAKVLVCSTDETCTDSPTTTICSATHTFTQKTVNPLG